MQILVPYTYTAKAIPAKCRDARQVHLYENAEVEIPDVEPSDMVPALDILSNDDALAERFYSYGGRIWILDQRSPDELPYLPQHLDYAGFSVRSEGTRHAKADAENGLKEKLRRLGILCRRTGKVEQHHHDKVVFLPDGRRDYLETTAESEKLRQADLSLRGPALFEAESIARKAAVAVDGRVYVAVPEPVLMASGIGSGLSWRIGLPKMKESMISVRFGSERMPVSFLDAAQIVDWLGEEKQESSFRFVIHNPSVLKADCRKHVLVRDIAAVLADGLDKSQSTAFINNWCRLRDFVQPVAQSLSAQADVFLDEACSLLADTVRRDRNQLVKFHGINMWESRPLSIDAGNDFQFGTQAA